jgi:hypothetical protein
MFMISGFRFGFGRWGGAFDAEAVADFFALLESEARV